MRVAFSRGEQEVNIGDRFTFLTGDRWEVVKLVANGMYSPSGLGGTPVFACKSLDDHMPGYIEKYVEPDGTVEFCGDSIAAALARSAPQTGDAK